MKKQILIIVLFLASGMQLSLAQKRIGAEVRLVPYSFLESTYDTEGETIEVTTFPQAGLYFQRWVSDRRFRYSNLTYQGSRVVQKIPFIEYEMQANVTALHYGTGIGYYLNHKEFEDKFATYLSWGIGAAIFRYTEEETHFGIADKPETYYHSSFTFEFGFGVEKSLTKKLLANAAIEAHAQGIGYNPVFMSLTLRLLYRRY